MNNINNISVKAFNQLNENDYDVYVNCTSDKPLNIDKINFRLPVEDNGDESQYDKLFWLIIQDDCQLFKNLDLHRQQKEKCCIFCNQGRQRSCCVYVCYLMYNNYSMSDAITYLRKNKADAFFGNINFLSTLLQFQNYIKIKINKIN